MLKMIGFVALFAASLCASPSILEDLAKNIANSVRGEAPKLSKSTGSSILTQTTYSSANYNVHFEAPAGWAITSIDSVANRVLLNVAKSGRNSVLIYVTKHATASEAIYWDAYSAWLGVRTAYGASLVTPYVLSALDTLSSPYHLSYVQLEYETQSSTRVYDLVAASKGTVSQFVAYSATTADYDVNFADYDAIWEGMSFYDDVVAVNGGGGSVLPKGGTGVTIRGNTVLNPHGLRLEFRDANGRTRQTSSQKRIELDKAQKLFLQVK
jgi:hypothetical protein